MRACRQHRKTVKPVAVDKLWCRRVAWNHFPFSVEPTIGTYDVDHRVCRARDCRVCLSAWVRACVRWLPACQPTGSDLAVYYIAISTNSYELDWVVGLLSVNKCRLTFDRRPMLPDWRALTETCPLPLPSTWFTSSRRRIAVRVFVNTSPIATPETNVAYKLA